MIQTHAVKSHFLARSAGLPGHAPWVAFHHGYTWPSVKASAYNQLDRWSLRAADRVLTVCAPFRDELARFGVRSDRIGIVHNAIPPDWGARARRPEEAAALRARTGIAPDTKVVLIVGRLSREKDHLTLLEAVGRLRSAFALHLIIVGDGPERSRIEDRVRRLGLGASVTLTGHQSSAEPWYGIADVAVLSSLSEGSPNALLEAMATNVPVVATAVGGVPEIVADGESGLLIKPGDPAGMSAAIARLLTEPDLAERLKKQSHQLILDRHAPEARTRKLVLDLPLRGGCVFAEPVLINSPQPGAREFPSRSDSEPAGARRRPAAPGGRASWQCFPARRPIPPYRRNPPSGRFLRP